jgi:hypothetical protein
MEKFIILVIFSNFHFFVTILLLNHFGSMSCLLIIQNTHSVERMDVEMILKSIDLSLMVEHLNTHKGVIARLESAFCTVQSHKLKQIIYEQLIIMRNHVKVMLLLIDPNSNDKITVADLNKVEPATIQCSDSKLTNNDKNIALELRNTSMTMAHGNFSSALRMKTENVRDIHFHMALQQVSLQQRYTHYIEQNMKEVSPESSLQEQLNTLHLLNQMFSDN